MAILMTIPAASATWRGRGFFEPDTELDRTEGFMFLDPDTSPDSGVRQVYFSTYSAQFIAGVNPNSGATGSNIAAYPSSIHAILGVWKDCNKDGYIGSVEGGLLEYRSTLLLDKTVCPEQLNLDPWAEGYVPVHNDGEWVHELIWIGPDHILASSLENGCYWKPTAFECTRRENATNPYNIADEGARIWADWGLPDDAPAPSCPVNPRPRGTYQSTGGFLRYTDCFTGWRVTGTINAADAATGLDEALGIQLSFASAAKEHPEQSDSTLNQANPYGQESDGSYVTAWDCNAEPTTVKDPTGGQAHGVAVTDPTDGDTYYANLTDDENNVQPLWAGESGAGIGGYATTGSLEPWSDESGQNMNDIAGGVNTPRVPSVSTTGSPAGTANHTLEGAAGDCDRSQGVGEASNVYTIDEDDFEGSPPLRVRTDIVFTFSEGVRAERKASTNQQLDGILGQGRPPTASGGTGLSWTLLGSPSWFGSPGYLVSRNPYVNRGDLQPWGGVHVTAYAKVTDTTVQLPGSTGTYGAGHCTSAGAPVTGLWACDDMAWYPPAKEPTPDQPPTGRNLWHAVVGDEYNLKDTDCYDASLTPQQPVTTGDIGPTQCKR